MIVIGISPSMNPTRVYLDHKDFANITKGLLGNPQHQLDVEWYGTLSQLVSDGRLVCFFSAIQVVEAIRSSDDAWLKAYAEVVDNLTDGHCLVSHAPYVHYLVTDRYFATTIAKSLSGRFPQTVILRNAGELCDRLFASEGR